MILRAGTSLSAFARAGFSSLSRRHAAIALFVLTYAAFLMWNPNHGFRDYEILREVVFASEDFFPNGVFPSMGRFYPMFVREFALIWTVSQNIVWIYLFVSLQCVLFAWLMWRLLSEATSRRGLVAATLCGLFLLPAFTNSWGALATCERSVAFYLACFFLAYRAYNERRHALFAIAALLAANAAIYYKEPVFLSIVVFAIARLWIARAEISLRKRWLDFALLASGVVFVGMYVIFAYLPRGPHVYGEQTSSLLKNIANFALNDPVATFLALPLAMLRLRVMLLRPRQAHPLYDPMLLAGAAYALAFLALGIYAPNYWLPVYVFTLPPILFYLGARTKKHSLFWKTAIASAVVLLVANAIPLGVHILSTMKYPGPNSILAFDALAQDLRIGAGARPAIFLDGVAPELTAHDITQTYDRDAYFNVAQALKRRGIAPQSFDLKSELPPKKPVIKPRPDDPASMYTAFVQDDPAKPQAGDYLLITPNTTKAISDDYLDGLTKHYDLIHRTPAGQWAIPNVALRNVLKRILLRFRPGEWVVDENLSRRPDYYVFKRK